ncbi:hypothetical protein EIN_347030 [Entamoeba invadens IP1]|uniref:Leucine rich repeat containing protein BspA family protein n=1 Tax=Entamoeba invadens IP1 TaxID=370355 RepID=L7FJJ3_ENTIV|nr:hypothetical protein EIN_347030 [Entamoeba invadens IP1]ELP84026.1 hypothetical protein EIN_347030 [Entamoeba invadens IP1]|eukprot:XP_004183372.1 hypothetical protein EIN_347030 [Entamoeba invadens IP1]
MKIFKDRITENIKMCELSGYHIMIVSKYFKTIKDFINLELLCKKFGGNMEKFHFNPIPLNCNTLGYFPNIETLHLWDVEDENFGNGFMINRKENKDIENEVVLKREFYQIIVWFNVDFETVDRNISRNIKFKNVTYTKNDREKFGNNIPSSVTSIGDDCFSGCNNINRITIPLSVTSIGKSCFNKCSSLSNVTIPSSVTSINDYCFNRCSSLSNVILPSSVTSIGKGCFRGCSSLSSVTIQSSVTLINDYSFFGCSNLSSVNIPSSVTSIGIYCFNECNSLTSITIPSSVTSINDYCFNGCSSLSNVILPSSVTSIGKSCFRGCNSLSSITIPLSVKSIGEYCFPSNTVVYRANEII